MARYLGNAFSLGMIDFLHDDSGVSEVCPRIVGLSLEQARGWLAISAWESCVGHADTAMLVSAMLGVSVEVRRVSTSLRPGDSILVAQYNGPRLPEGATSLPEGAKIRWYLIEVPW